MSMYRPIHRHWDYVGVPTKHDSAIEAVGLVVMAALLLVLVSLGVAEIRDRLQARRGARRGDQ